MITPTVGRVVWFAPARGDTAMTFGVDQPCAALVAYVWNDRMVNLAVFDHNGAFHARTSVPLLQDDDAKPEGGYFATWMPYQKGQAAKTEAAEAKLAGNAA
jgi:hypothetical protein